MSKQLIGKKLLNKCSHLLGSNVIAGFMNGSIPHNIIEVWTDVNNAYLINLKTKEYMLYVDNGTFVMRRGTVKVRPKQVEQTKEEEIQRIMDVTGVDEFLALKAFEATN